ncbi:type II secretion system minor pseudopilin GspK [Roseateles sp. UC29_93]|uniref:type II secretion system minor pseudopilin GspK n=1 Tax=Roseateles sp. UC29_93 TaxID=3350177 RepID=UPI00366E6D61
MRAVHAPARAPRSTRSRRGAALLTALLIVVLVTTLSAAMLWRQSRSIQIEAADRGRAQADWVLQGALDWARLILSEDVRSARNNTAKSDDLGEVWAVPLAEARLSSFLSQDENKSEDSGPDAFLSGHIEDAQGLFNLRNLETQPAQTQPGQAPDPQAVQKALDNLNAARRIFQRAGMSASIAEQVQKNLIASAGSKGTDQQGEVPLRPARIEQLRWFGLNDEQIARLSTLAVLLPKAQTTLNLNTAPREVIADVLGVDLGVADSIVRARQSKAFTAWDDRLTSLVAGIPRHRHAPADGRLHLELLLRRRPVAHG